MFFINSRNKNINDIFFNDSVDVDYIREILTFCKTFSTVKVILEAYLEPIRTSTIKLFCNFQSFQRGSTADVPLGSKYASAYTYIQVSPIEIMHNEFFRCKISFSYKRRMK